MNLKKQVFSGFVWRFVENTSAYFISFIIQIILARLLMPEDFGLIATASVFITIMSVFIQTGFSSAIVQKKELNEVEQSSVFYVGLVFSIILYIILFISSGFIANFYHEPRLIFIIKIQSISLVIGAIISVQTALIQREMNFKLSFIKSIISSFFQAIVGITMALNNFGVYALVYSNLIKDIVVLIIILIIIDWKPKKTFSWYSVKKLFSFSSKVLLTALMNTIRDNTRSLIIGKKYSSEMLGYYNRGYQLPSLVMSNAVGALNSILFPTLSKVQDDHENVLKMYRCILKIACFITFPLMLGLIVLAEPIIIILFTEKWAMSIPYVRLTSIQCMILPFAMCLQVFLSIGRSDLVLKLCIYGFIISFTSLFITYNYGVYWLVVGLIIAEALYCLGEMAVLQKVMKYSILRQFFDVWKSIFSAIIMAFMVYLITIPQYSNLLKLVIGIPFGIIIYYVFSVLIKNESLFYIKDIIKSYYYSHK
ncbi:MAG: hypothetical protein A2Y17_07365 [Clostridiales bacterium GWF2_38_85]|nr:MAG: hypothetical protein A2Y17_07365 [Clostridiales bacterium GWF2_38_85]